MAKIAADGVCPFCAEYFRKYHPKPIVKETDFWFVTENISPYIGTKYHFIFVYKPKHITKPSEFVPGTAEDLFTLVNQLVEENQIPGGSFFMRFGDTRYNGSSVEHLHGQLIMGDVDAPGHEKVRVKLG
jgi:diadenosine tetraphosphate (Ap4A) HIT family hydrolase